MYTSGTISSYFSQTGYKLVEFAHLFVQFLSSGGHAAVIVVLLAACGILLWERKKIVKSLDETTQKVLDAKDHESTTIQEIVERYHQGNVDLIHALNEIKVVLSTFQHSKK